MNSLADFDRIAKHVFREPRFVAEVEWHRDYGLSAQLFRQIGDQAATFVATGEWVDPDVRVPLVDHEMPDFAWWEPRHDHPWRRQAARDRGDAA